MKIHQPLIEAISSACKQILIDKHHANYVIQKTLQENKKFGSRDRKFIVENTVFVIKNVRLLAEACKQWPLISEIKETVSTALYAEELLKLLSKKTLETKIKHSFPDWLDALLAKDLGKKKWELEAGESNALPSTFIRINSSKTTTETCQKALEEEGVICLTTKLPFGLVLNKKQDITQTTAYKNGWIEIQDIGSQQIGFFCEVKPYQKVIDVCAGAGGKTMQLADLMKNKGQIIALDIVEKKLKELQKRALRNGVDIVKTSLNQSQVQKKDWADLVLIDAPCSGLGVLKRNPDDKWKLNQESLDQLITTQAALLENHSVSVKANGLLVYATCSIYSGENQAQTKQFLDNHPEFEKIDEQQLFPSDGCDGFYMAKLRKK
jgi:16S rRNA (cytosine967-C5)-methyltransferase